MASAEIEKTQEPTQSASPAVSEKKSADDIVAETPGKEAEIEPVTDHHSELEDAALYKNYPTEEEWRTLRRVAGKIPWTAYTVAFVELCERFSYYGTTAACTKPNPFFFFHPQDNQWSLLIWMSNSRQLHPAAAAGGLDDGRVAKWR